MPYLSTPNAFLEQSSLLLEAYPDDTRITTKYNYPPPKANTNSKGTVTQDPATTTTTTPIATLTLKTFNPVTGICLKYRTNKAAEVGRLISGLGKLAAGTKISPSSAVGPGDESAAAVPAATTGDVEMADAPAASPAVGVGAGSGGGGGVGKKKKGGKGKR